MIDQNLRALVDLRDKQIQKARIQFGNRADAILREDDAGNAVQLETVLKWYKTFARLEDELDKDIAKIVKQHPIYDSITAVKGVGPMMAAKLIALIDISRPDTPAALWRYAGYAVFDGKRERSEKGVKNAFNIRLKSTCYLIGVSFIKCDSPYRQLYDKQKEFYMNERDWTRAHCHHAAIRYMAKRFLAHLWLEWRTLEGLPTRRPYVQDVLKHTHIDRPQDYGWPQPTKKRNPLP